MAAMRSNQPSPVEAQGTLSVADLDRLLRNVVERATVGVWVQGEVSSVRFPPSGHAYFCLKDENEDAVIDAVAYREAALRARRLLVDGTRVTVRGKATVWAPRGRLQLVVEAVRAAGRGALLEALEKLKERLAAEGLFDAERKVAVPTAARFIGVVTSPTGAVIHDIIRVAFRRGSVRILLSPALVQGDDAPESLLAALDRLEKVRGLEVIIIGRGGGSLEDLMAFNDERVVRRVAACKVPIVSAVGHEVDVTLTDLAADARASTPSQAAELVVGDALSQRENLVHMTTRLRRAMRVRASEDRSVLDRLWKRMGDPRVLIGERRQRMDDLMSRLDAGQRVSLGRKRALLERLARRLASNHPKAVLARARGRTESLEQRLKAGMRQRLATESAALQTRMYRLRALSPLSVLARGYAIATGPDGKALRAAASVSAGDVVGVRLSEGSLVTQVTETKE